MRGAGVASAPFPIPNEPLPEDTASIIQFDVIRERHSDSGKEESHIREFNAVGSIA
jgi:hypothetical protein